MFSLSIKAQKWLSHFFLSSLFRHLLRCLLLSKAKPRLFALHCIWLCFCWRYMVLRGSGPFLRLLPYIVAGRACRSAAATRAGSKSIERFSYNNACVNTKKCVKLSSNKKTLLTRITKKTPNIAGDSIFVPELENKRRRNQNANMQGLNNGANNTGKTWLDRVSSPCQSVVTSHLNIPNYTRGIAGE